MARIRSTKRGKTAAVAAAARDTDFRYLWRQLRRVGWTAKRPTGIETEWRYVAPDSSEVFVGEDAVVVHALESGLLAEDEGDEESELLAADQSETESGLLAGCHSEEDEGNTSSTTTVNAGDGIVGASQIDTSTKLSQRTLDDLFGSESDSDVALSQAAVPRAFDLSPGDLEDAGSEHNAAASLQLLSEASAVESEADVGDDRAATPGPVLRPTISVKKDINFVPEDDNLSSYESFSSGESDIGGIEDSNDGAAVVDTPSDDDVLSDDDAPQMDRAFVQSLLIGEDVLNKKAADARSNALRATKWTPVSSAFEEASTAYPGLNTTEEAKPVQELQNVCHSPLLTLFYFMPKSLWVAINVETNRYCMQQIARRAQAIHAKLTDRTRETPAQIRRRLQAKPAYQTHEILQVLGLLIARVLCPQNRRFAAHWSMTEDGAVPAGTFGRFMGRNRCQDILRDLHIVDNERERTRDKFWKIRPIVNKLQEFFLAAWSLPPVFSFDEGV